MRILQVNNFHYPRGGSDRYFLDLCTLLEERGHQVATLSTQHAANESGKRLATSALAPIQTDRPSGLGDAVRFVYSSRARRAMRAAIQQFRPDLVHLHIYYGQLTASILEPIRSAGIPIVQTLHEYKLICPTHGLYAHNSYCDACKGRHYWQAVVQRCNRNSFARSTLSMVEAYISAALGARSSIDQFIAVSEFQKNELTLHGISAERIEVVPLFCKPSNLSARGPGKYFLFVGRLVSGKGLRDILDAYAIAGRRLPKLHVVGIGPEEENLKNYARERGLAEHIVWCGYQSNTALASQYQECIALINPSHLNETFGLTSLEALANGRPVISSNSGALPELVRNGIDGYVFPAGNVDSLATILTRCNDQPRETEALGWEGYKRVLEKFSAEVHYQRINRLYENLLCQVAQIPVDH